MRTGFGYNRWIGRNRVTTTTLPTRQTTPANQRDGNRPDIARVNLEQAVGLPHGIEGDAEIDACLATLDEWAGRVAAETRRMWPDWLNDPAYYDRDEAVFRMMTLVTVLQRDLGVRYNPEAVGNWDFRDARDSFLHGLLADRRTGTCVNIPVLYVAAGRRLGYPLHLALAKGHYFVRWQRPDGTHLNFDGTNQGLSVHGDDFYLSWPRAITPGDLARGEYLRALSPAEELACFLGSRGHCLEDHGQVDEAAACYGRAAGLMPCSSYFPGHLRNLRAGNRPPEKPTGWDAFALTPARPFATIDGVAVGFAPAPPAR